MEKIKYAFFSMDIEDWFETTYLMNLETDKSFSMLDGVDNFLDVCKESKVKPTFFILSDLAKQNKILIRKLAEADCEIACHGKTHQPPNTMTNQMFSLHILEAKQVLEDLSGKIINGYRASSYGMDADKYSIVMNAGFTYSSSMIESSINEYYGKLILPEEFREIQKGIFTNGNFFEFQLPVHKILNINLPVGGGGYLRIIPWIYYYSVIKNYLENNNSYIFYIHPFEFSKKTVPEVYNLGLKNNYRLRHGLKENPRKVLSIIDKVKHNKFQSITFSEWINNYSDQISKYKNRISDI